MIYARPFYIVYGTPNDVSIRTAIRDLAIYLANSHLAAHGTFVQVLSDFEYKSEKCSDDFPLSNILMIGGPAHNKLMRKLCIDKSIAYQDSDGREYLIGAGFEKLFCYSPVWFSSDEASEPSFRVGSHMFNSSTEAVMFTLPIARPVNALSQKEASMVSRRSQKGSPEKDYVPITFTYANSESVMGGCIHANTALGYHHVSRAAWPVVPPMVRAPFTNYIPDFLVLNHKIWPHGFGGVRLAGYWDSNWQFDEKQSHVN